MGTWSRQSGQWMPVREPARQPRPVFTAQARGAIRFKVLLSELMLWMPLHAANMRDGAFRR
jgi:hypothetical protein